MLPSPEQAAVYASIRKRLESFLWEHPDGGKFEVGHAVVSQALAQRLSDEIMASSWAVSNLTDSGRVVLEIRPKTGAENPQMGDPKK